MIRRPHRRSSFQYRYIQNQISSRPPRDAVRALAFRPQRLSSVAADYDVDRYAFT